MPVGTGLSIDVTEDDPSLFATAMVAESLAGCEDRRARRILQSAAEHLRDHMESPGVWRHWSSEHPQFHALPADADDTAWASCVLRLAQLPHPDNHEILLENRDREGRFHTWLLARRGRGVPSPGLLRVGLRRAVRPIHAHMFWRATSAEPDDVDGVVNANVLAYLGPGPHAAAPARYLESVLRAGAEDRCDKWYRSPFVLYAAVARGVAAGVGDLAGSAAIAEGRITAAARPDGRIGSGPLETALAIRALADLGRTSGSVVGPAAAYLESAQDDDGSWPAEPVYFGGPQHHPDVPCWGSRALTTGLCAGGLARVASPEVSPHSR